MVMAREMETLLGLSQEHMLSEGGQRGKRGSVQEVPWCNGEHSGL